MTGHIQNFKKYFPLLGELVTRDVKIKYRKSILGVFWTLLNPLLMMLVLSVVFQHLLRFQVENYGVYILCGQVIFNFYSEATTSSMTAILNNAPLIQKIYIPKYLFVLSRVASSVINIMASFSALVLVMIFQRIELHYTLFLGIVPVLLLVIFSIGVGLILAAITVRFRDVIHLYGVFMTALMYLTPVIYPMDLLDNQALVRKVVELNPLTNYLDMFRKLVMYGTLPGVTSFVIGFVVAVAALAIGMYVFYKRQDSFILDL